MKRPNLRALISLFAIAATLGGCAATDPGNANLDDRLGSRDASYENRLDRRGMRRQSRDERYDAWFDSL